MAKRKIIWSPGSKLDLFEILEFYYKQNYTKTYSRKLNLTFRKSIRLLMRNPEIGFNTDIQNIRNLIEGDFSIFCKIQANTIEVITIWDNRQSPDELDLR